MAKTRWQLVKHYRNDTMQTHTIEYKTREDAVIAAEDILLHVVSETVDYQYKYIEIRRVQTMAHVYSETVISIEEV